MTTPVRIVLTALRAHDGPVYGLQLAKLTGLGTGTLYPLLHRLQTAGWLTCAKETGPHPSRPARRFWAVTDKAPTP
jgi:DNA-binding PadR family transcriptional regulator